jgi:hypothetical protein
MKPIERTVPARHPKYFAVEIGEKGAHHFREPLPSKAWEITSMFSKHPIDTKKQLQDALTGADFAAAIGNTRHWSEVLAGIVIGHYWYNRKLDLDVSNKIPSEEFGAAVYEALYYEGYSESEIALMYDACMNKLKAACGINDDEVKEIVDFSN